eukprot:1528221-Prymnesium_polylepis.1
MSWARSSPIQARPRSRSTRTRHTHAARPCGQLGSNHKTARPPALPLCVHATARGRRSWGSIRPPPWAQVCTVFIALQDVGCSMGPTIFLPRSHSEEAHATFVWGQPHPWGGSVAAGADDAEGGDERGSAAAASGPGGAGEDDERRGSAWAGSGAHDTREDGECVDDGSDGAAAAATSDDDAGDDGMAELLRRSPCRVPLLRRGDAICFDSRLLHAGGAHAGGARRVLFYFSLRARRAALPEGYRSSLLDDLQGRFGLDAHGRLEERRESLVGRGGAAGPPRASEARVVEEREWRVGTMCRRAMRGL